MDLYVLDTSVIVTLGRSMPQDVYISVWAALEALIAEPRAFMPRDAYEELERVDDECAPWAKSQTGFVVDPSADEITLVAEITNAHPEWVQETTNAADPFLVAHAAVHGRVLVTQERAKGPGTADHNLKIPNVASEYGVTCVEFNDLARREGWQF